MSLVLLAKGWRGARGVGGEPLSFELPTDAELAFLQSWITKENAASLASNALDQIHAQIKDVQVASVDIDGNDSHIVRPLLAAGLAPDVLSLNITPNFLPASNSKCLTMSAMCFRPDDDFQSASLQQWVKILRIIGLSPVTKMG